MLRIGVQVGGNALLALAWSRMATTAPRSDRAASIVTGLFVDACLGG